ncbi:hypothetical protein KSI01_18360 [Kurthia sibirica]|nr:hypothetical protein KSI01_18360 [Kurthia sibirica]
MASIDTSLAFLKKLTINSLFDISTILAGDNYIWKLVILIVIGILFYIASIIVFKFKKLPF